MERRTAGEHEIEPPWLVCVDVREHAARDAGDIEHVSERIHMARLIVWLCPTHI
jgi:hypothetical protein